MAKAKAPVGFHDPSIIPEAFWDNYKIDLCLGWFHSAVRL